MDKGYLLSILWVGGRFNQPHFTFSEYLWGGMIFPSEGTPPDFMVT